MTRPALVAVAHGTAHPLGARTTEALLDQVRALLPDVTVTAAYLDHSSPTVDQALVAAASHASRVVVVPLLFTAAYHATVDIPQAIAAARQAAPRLEVSQAAILGIGPLVADAVEARAAAVGVRAADGRPLLVVAAGSSDVVANASVARLSGRLVDRGWSRAEVAFIAAGSPRVGDVLGQWGAEGVRGVVGVPLLMTPSAFADRAREAATAVGAAVTWGSVVGDHAAMAALVAQRYEAALT